MPRVLRKPQPEPQPAEPSISHVDALLTKVVESMNHYRNHSGRMSELRLRADQLLDRRLVLADRRFRARYEETR